MSGYKDYGFKVDAPAHTMSYLQEPILAMLDKSINKCILDLGCGNGYLVNFLIGKGYNAFGTDASAEGITIAGQTNAGRFFLQDLSTGKLPPELQGKAFDTILSTEVIEHLYDPRGFIDFCKQTINNNGEIIISTPYHGYLKNLMLSLFNKWDTHLNPMWYGGHIKLWSRKTLSNALIDAGFTDIKFKGCGRIPYFWKSMIIKARLS
ncbi:bifunctional 2-polyprenyl-6-hydroxyphenol methylase/3-demethylubiquinol 3-O-methyltransferase UbiG [Mucilaginibacter sp. UR6-11]|uniref:class I SAM-dependent methyltransferase n=1 Tax=Mucilaginibacter sp. UR6-11 TaxID=1435644 RepID=UPI001E2BE1A3|nr:class I SAM-dependent methyltransferase [Mucilaginibacter sp. UR6-11]MCC8425743.1 class I SAM-dependent methyltransferase [Mucilaginibacter sp. UR6-11]